jgi:hypothetical protein
MDEARTLGAKSPRKPDGAGEVHASAEQYGSGRNSGCSESFHERPGTVQEPHTQAVPVRVERPSERGDDTRLRRPAEGRGAQQVDDRLRATYT